jgi:hypothetical protein
MKAPKKQRKRNKGAKTKVEASKQHKRGVTHGDNGNHYVSKPPPVTRSISTKERGGKLNKTSSLEEPSPLQPRTCFICPSINMGSSQLSSICLYMNSITRVNLSWSISTTYNTTHWSRKCQGSLMIKLLGQPQFLSFLELWFCFSVLWWSWICNHPFIRPFSQIWISRIMKVKKN